MAKKRYKPRCMGYGKGWTGESYACKDCAKKDKINFNRCKKLTFESLVQPNYPDNDEIVKSILSPEDWEYYCKKIIKRKPKIAKRKQGRRSDILTYNEIGKFLNE